MKYKFRTIVLTILFICLLGVCSFAGEVSVRFGQTASNGKFKNKYSKWNAKVETGTRMQLPTLHGDGSYLWEGKMNGKVIRAAEGFSCKITGKVDFSLKRTKKCIIRFCSQSNVEYKKLRIALPATTTCKLPTMEDQGDLKFAGWGVRIGESKKLLAAGKGIRAAGNATYYAVFRKKRTRSDEIYLYFSDGTYYMTLDRSTDPAPLFPSPDLGGEKMLMGWSTKKNQTKNPQFVEDSKIPAGCNVYYMVISDRQKEPAFRFSMLRSPRNYSLMFMLGDSRLAYARYQFGGLAKGVKFIARSGSGYDWLTGHDPTCKGGAWSKLIQYLKIKKKAGLLQGRSAVICEFGVNDLQNIDRYITYYKQMSRILKAYRCDLYVMSVNPFSRGCLERVLIEESGVNTNTKTMPAVIEFNRKLRASAGSAYRYIDTYSYLMKTGWCSQDPIRKKGDGLHYSPFTGARMINFAIMAADARF